MKGKNDEELEDLSISALTEVFADKILSDTQNLIKGIEFLTEENFEEFDKLLKHVIKSAKEVEIKKTFESKIWKAKLMFSKADRLKVFSKINDMKNIGEFIAHKLLLYRVVFPDEKFKLRIQGIVKSLSSISSNLVNAIKLISSDLERAHDICEEIKEERRKMRREEWALLEILWNYEMDYLSRTFLYLKELVESIMMLADHIKGFSEYIQFLSTKYLIFR
ncbi:MAG: hypothetical protein EU548_02720 [Promethearchaeota archaeon]|nr:MAG: hypothetical protein EU548_02720 [Candidatus Lokiarchaeota archaeon]